MSDNASNAFVFTFDRAVGRFFFDVLTPLGYSPIDMFSPPSNLYHNLYPFQIPTPSQQALALIERDLFQELGHPSYPYSLYAIQIDCLDFSRLQEISSEIVKSRDTNFFIFSNNISLIDRIKHEPGTEIYETQRLLGLLHCLAVPKALH